jgi:hypothetical protein
LFSCRYDDDEFAKPTRSVSGRRGNTDHSQTCFFFSVHSATRGTVLYLSNGLAGKAIAYDGEPVVGAGGQQLAAAYHAGSDGGGVIGKPGGGYYYVSNSEIGGDYPKDFVEANRMATTNLTGGVYSLEFNANNELVGYKKVLGNTAKNCAGGTKHCHLLWNALFADKRSMTHLTSHARCFLQKRYHSLGQLGELRREQEVRSVLARCVFHNVALDA